MAEVVEVAVNAGGGDDGVGVGARVGSVFEDGLEGFAEIAAAQEIEAQSASVTVEGFVIAETIFGEQGVAADPVDEILFDIGAVGMMADGAFAGVALGIERVGGGVDQAGRVGVGGRDRWS